MDKNQLQLLFDTKKIQRLWKDSDSKPVIAHPQHGNISPASYRRMGKDKPCPYCAQKMVCGQDKYATSSKSLAIARGYRYLDRQGHEYINQAGNTYFHPHYVTIDHKLNKARCPEKMFDYDNLELICWRCNHDKGDNNAYALQHDTEYLTSLAESAISRYPLLRSPTNI